MLSVKLPEFVFGILEAFSNVVNGLEILVLIRLERSRGGIERPVLRLVAEGM